VVLAFDEPVGFGEPLDPAGGAPGFGATLMP
jgi:hypothetical protein